MFVSSRPGECGGRILVLPDGQLQSLVALLLLLLLLLADLAFKFMLIGSFL